MTGSAESGLDLPLRTDWSSIDLARLEIQRNLTSALSEEGCQTVAMVARELLENAIKYGNAEADDSTVRLRTWSTDSHVHVQVENPVKSGDSGAASLLGMLEWMNHFETPAEAFRSRILDPQTQGAGKLGLVRIAYEGNCTISADVIGSVLRVTAHVPIEADWRRLTNIGSMRQASPSMESLVAGGLRIEVSQSAPDGAVVLTWCGTSTDRNPTQTVTPYVRGIYEVASAKKVPVEMHFEKLEHFNSSTISALIQLIQEARTRQLKLLLTYDASLRWQRLNFDALRVFAKDELLTVRQI